MLASILLLVLCASLMLSGRGCVRESAVSAEASESEELAALLSSLEGVGRCEVSIRYGEDGEILGVVILCDGAGNVQTRERVILLVSTLFHIGTNRIRVEKLSGTGEIGVSVRKAVTIGILCHESA